MSDDVLSSLQNPQIKALGKLLHARERARTGLTRIDGARELQRALDGGLVPETVYVCAQRLTSRDARAAVEAAIAAGARRQPVNETVYAKIQYGDRDEGLCATVRWQPRPLEALAPTPDALWLVLDGLEKPGNFGAVLRTADAAGAQAVILSDPVLDPANPNAVRASLGTLFTVPVVVGAREATIERLRDLHIDVVAAVVQGDTPYTDVDLRGPLALVLGPERDAPADAWQQTAVHRVRIPLRGAADSLNVSVAAAVLLFEAVRQREAG